MANQGHRKNTSLLVLTVLRKNNTLFQTDRPHYHEDFGASMASVLPLCAGISLAYLLLCLVQRYWRLRGIPGPYLASVTDFWRFRIQYFGPILPTLGELHQRHGTVVRIGPNKVSVSSAKNVKTIYTNRGEFKKVN